MRSAFGFFLREKFAAVLEHVQVPRNYQVNFQLVKQRQKISFRLVDEAAQRPIVNRFVHENDSPRAACTGSLPAQPIRLRVLQARLELLQLVELRVQHEKPRRAVVERVKVPAVIFVAIRRQREIFQVPARLAHPPVFVVAFVVAHYRRQNPLAQQILRRRVPLPPLPIILPVVSKIAVHRENLSVRKILTRMLRRPPPRLVVHALAVAENQHFKFAVARRPQFLPRRSVPARHHAKFIQTRRLEILNRRAVNVILAKKISADFAEISSVRAKNPVFDFDIFERRGGVPHYRPRISRIRRDDLTQKFHRLQRRAIFLRLVRRLRFKPREKFF